MIAAEPDLPAHLAAGRLPAAARLAARQRPRAGRALRDAGADRPRHRPPARAAAVPAPPRDALPGVSCRALIAFLVAARRCFGLNSARFRHLEEDQSWRHRSLRCYAEGRDGDWEAICLDLDIAVQGSSFEEVFRSLQEAISLYLETRHRSAAARNDGICSTVRHRSQSGSNSWRMRCADCSRTVTATDNGISSPCLSLREAFIRGTCPWADPTAGIIEANVPGLMSSILAMAGDDHESRSAADTPLVDPVPPACPIHRSRDRTRIRMKSRITSRSMTPVALRLRR